RLRRGRRRRAHWRGSTRRRRSLAGALGREVLDGAAQTDAAILARLDLVEHVTDPSALGQLA
ncbi:MAG: hypothetical protein ACRCZP_08885, partial [Phycicoccus sp.]